MIGAETIHSLMCQWWITSLPFSANSRSKWWPQMLLSIPGLNMLHQSRSECRRIQQDGSQVVRPDHSLRLCRCLINHTCHRGLCLRTLEWCTCRPKAACPRQGRHQHQLHIEPMGCNNSSYRLELTPAVWIPGVGAYEASLHFVESQKNRILISFLFFLFFWWNLMMRFFMESSGLCPITCLVVLTPVKSLDINIYF